MLGVFYVAIVLALLASIAGCFVVWRGIEYYGDAVSHILLTCVAVGAIFDGGLIWTVLLPAPLISLLMTWISNNYTTSGNAIGVLANGLLSLGVTVLAFSDSHEHVDHVLIGSFASAGLWEMVALSVLSVAMLGFVYFFKSGFLLATINKDLARTCGINTFLCDFVYYLILTLFLGVSLHLAGVLLVGSLIIVPASCARFLCGSVNGMFQLSALIGCSSMLIGLFANYAIPLVPVGGVAATLNFILFMLLFLMKHKDQTKPTHFLN